MATTPLPGHSIPYALTPAEIQAFLALHRAEPLLSEYLYRKQPPYGIIVNEDYGQLLVWSDASGVLHVIDVTNMSIAQQVQKAPYESPDASAIGNMVQIIEELISGGGSALQFLPLLAVGFIAFEVWKGQK